MRIALPLGIALVTVLLSGCSGADDPADDFGSDDLLSTDAPDEPRFEEVVLTNVEQTLWSGHTKEGAFVCDSAEGTGTCSAGQQVQPDGQHTTTVTYAGNFSAATVAIAWTPADATQTGLVLAIYGPAGLLAAVSGNGGDMRMEIPQGANLPADGALTLFVWPQAKVPGNPAVFLDATQQPFDVTVDVTTTTTETRAVEADPV